jgi:hypothetical protein
MGQNASDTLWANITNVDPTANITAQPATVNEGDDVVFDGYFDDPSWNDTHWANWSFGDGWTQEGSFSPGPGYGNTHHEMDAVTYAYGKKGVYTACLNVTDEFGGSDVACVQITVDNVVPAVSITADPNPVAEGADITFDGYFDDPSWNDTHWANWSFGDGWGQPGSFSPGPGYGNTRHEMDAVTYAYGKAGGYTACLNVTDEFGGFGQACVLVTVTNVDPVANISAEPNPVAEGTLVNFTGFFDDPSWNDTHSATWDFGDGWSQPGDFSPGPGYGNTHHVMNAVTYAYGRGGDHTACLKVWDEFDGYGEACVVINVTNVDPVVTANINTTTIPEGTPFIVNGSFYDPSWNDTHNATWDFGYYDNMTGYGPLFWGNFTPGPGYGNTTHAVEDVNWTYGDDGNYAIFLNVTDDLGGFGSDSVRVDVYNVPPELHNVTAILHQNAPRTHGYWKYECKVKNPKPDHPGIRQEWVDAIRENSTVFTDVYTKEDVCAYLDPPKPMTPMKKAKMQLMALWLNVVSGLLWIDSPLHHPAAPQDETVREFIEHAEWLILNDPTDANLNWINEVATDINEDADGGNDWQYIDPLVGEYLAYVTDPGTDDLMFVWRDDYYQADYTHYHYNNGVGPEEDYVPLLNEVRTPWGTYPFVVVDRLVLGYPASITGPVPAHLVCVMDDDDGKSSDAEDCPDNFGFRSSGSGMLDGPYATVDWTFNFTIAYRQISGGFTIAEVTATFLSYDPQVIPIITGGKFD